MALLQPLQGGKIWVCILILIFSRIFGSFQGPNLAGTIVKSKYLRIRLLF